MRLSKAVERGIELLVDCDPDTPKVLDGDPLRLQQIYDTAKIVLSHDRFLFYELFGCGFLIRPDKFWQCYWKAAVLQCVNFSDTFSIFTPLNDLDVLGKECFRS